MDQQHAVRDVDVTDTDAIREFVRQSDMRGPPDSERTAAYWETVRFYRPEWLIARAAELPALSADYFDLQDQLYIFIRGRPYTARNSELTAFDKEAALAGRLAYPNRTPRELNRYMRAHAKFADLIASDAPCDVLEVGSGWGFSSEYLARLGHRVTAVDINPDFVDVAARRSERDRLGIDYRLGTFEDLPLKPGERFDLVYCFEAFHHARDFRATLSRLVERLRPGGQFIIFGEPFIGEDMWPSWGLRLDPLSIYCIAKFGWWEAGWTHAFMSNVFRSCGLAAAFIDKKADLERYMVGHISRSYAAEQLSYRPVLDGWQRDRHYLISGGDSRIEFYRPLSSVEFRIESFAPTPLSARFESDALTEPMVVDLVPGTNRVMVPLSAYPPAEQWEIRIISQTWNPLQALGAGQDKEMAFHLVGLEEYVVDDAGSPKSC